MKALLFGVDPGLSPEEAEALITKLAAEGAGGVTQATEAGKNPLLEGLATTLMDIVEIEDAKPLFPDWVVIENHLTGICGSDAKQVFMNAGGGDIDNATTAFISFPHVLGHEVVGTISEVGADVHGLEVGQRVVFNCWLSCAPRGISPMCPACQNGDYPMCWNFTKGRLSPGIHTGNNKEATGGYAPFVPAHESMVFPIPDNVTDEVAVLADPFAVSLHSITRNPPPPNGKAVVYGAGALGSSACAILQALYPSVEVAVVARWKTQKTFSESFGAKVFEPEPREALVEQLTEWSGGELHRPWEGLPIARPGQIDVVYDTIGTPETVEVAMRVVKERGTIVVSGVHAPGRFEWTPLYFKEIHLVGSNAFGIEEVEGVRKHAIEHYLDMASNGRIDISKMLTHTFKMEQWREAFTCIAEQGNTGAIKVAFDYRS